MTPKDIFKNNIRNIDFGLVERARQVLSLDKHIRSAKITLADGNILVNAVLDEDGTSPIPAGNDDYRLGYLKASDGITFYAADDRSRTIRVTERTQVKIYEAENGAFDVCFTDGTGTLYTAQVTEDMLESGGEDALRMSIIIILCVIAVGIGAVYVLLVPKKSKN